MGKYSKKADALFTELTEAIAEIVKLKGSKAGFKTEKVIELDSHSFEHPVHNNCEITFIGKTLMYDKYGKQYAFMDLGIDDLAELVDTLDVI